MADFNRPSVEFVRQALRYEDGKLFWLTRPREHFSTDADWKIWNKGNSGNEAGCLVFQKRRQYWVRMVCLQGWRYQRSVLTWVIVKGEWPSLELDHEDRNSTNDNIDNLRLATRSQNMANSSSRKDNQSGLKGVSFRKHDGKYMVRLQVNKKRMYFGLFDTAEEAHEAYLIAAKKYFGEFACDGK